MLNFFITAFLSISLFKSWLRFVMQQLPCAEKQNIYLREYEFSYKTIIEVLPTV